MPIPVEDPEQARFFLPGSLPRRKPLWPQIAFLRRRSKKRSTTADRRVRRRPRSRAPQS